MRKSKLQSQKPSKYKMDC